MSKLGTSPFQKPAFNYLQTVYWMEQEGIQYGIITSVLLAGEVETAVYAFKHGRIKQEHEIFPNPTALFESIRKELNARLKQDEKQNGKAEQNKAKTSGKAEADEQTK